MTDDWRLCWLYREKPEGAASFSFLQLYYQSPVRNGKQWTIMWMCSHEPNKELVTLVLNYIIELPNCWTLY